MEYGKIALGKAIKLGWLELKKSSNGLSECFPKITSLSEIQDSVHLDLKKLQSAKGSVDALNKEKAKEFKSRKLIQEVYVIKILKRHYKKIFFRSLKFLLVTKGSDFKTVLEKPEVDLTAEMLAR